MTRSRTMRRWTTLATDNRHEVMSVPSSSSSTNTTAASAVSNTNSNMDAIVPWRPLLAGAATALVHHAILWMLQQHHDDNKKPITINSKHFYNRWQSYRRTMLRIYQDSVVPSVMIRIRRMCRQLSQKRREDFSLSSFVRYTPLLAAILLAKGGGGGNGADAGALMDRHQHQQQQQKQRAWWCIGAATSWMMLSQCIFSTSSSDTKDDTFRSFFDDDDNESGSERNNLPSRRLRDPTTPPRHSTTNTTTKERSDSTSSKAERYLELLVHNVSHTDLILSCASSDQQQEPPKEMQQQQQQQQQHQQQQQQDPFSLCRPRFSMCDLYSRKALEKVITRPAGQQLHILRGPRYQRSLDSPRLPIHDEPTNFPMTPIGLQLPEPVTIDSWHDLRLRGRDQARIVPSANEKGRIEHVFFPLLATLLPRWNQQIAQKTYPHGKPVQRVLVLVTGVGTPRNWTHSMTGNSTEAAADLMRVFLQHVDPFLTVVHIHSKTNIFRYDENLLFVERELLPAIEAYRDAHARGLAYPTNITKSVVAGISKMTTSSSKATLLLSASHQQQQQDAKHPFNLDWQKSFSVTLSFADGSPARTHAIQASLRPYRPAYFHFWQLKTFWHESKIVDDDIEVHTFESMDNDPPIDAAQCVDPWINMVIAEMKCFLEETVQASRDRFWLRKTQKGVLAVLLVQTPDMEQPVLYRGTNMEVSMPTGSLCAERNVIGSALAQNPALKREDLKLIAVLAVPPPPEEQQGSIRRVRSTSTITSLNERHSSIGSEQDLLLGSSGGGASGNRKSSVGSEHDCSSDAAAADWVFPPPAATTTEAENPVRRIPLFSSSQVRSSSRQHQRTVVVHSRKDLNPLAPCGTCHEWLKKIAEANPYFRILTFTDANCNGIYVSRCQQE